MSELLDLFRQNHDGSILDQRRRLLSRRLDQDGDGDLDMMDSMKFGAGKLFGS